MRDLCQLSAIEAASEIASGSITSHQLVSACLHRIDSRDENVRAWQYVDAEAALEQARIKDQQEPAGPLHGVPVGIKDVIDTQSMPTTYGSKIYKDFVPKRDATCVQRLQQAGAIILGKTVTAEFAIYQPGPTANPHNFAHTPGGSSSGSAAAVADFQVPLALGTQTAGSVIRPASFCGVIGFKSTKSRYDGQGMIDTAPHLDTLGAFSRSVDDLLLLDGVLGPDEAEPNKEKENPVIGVCRSPAWEHASSSMQAAILDVAERLRKADAKVIDIELPSIFDKLASAQKKIHSREAWDCLGQHLRNNPSQISEVLTSFLIGGRDLSDNSYDEALVVQESCKHAIDIAFQDADLLLTPSATGTAPLGLLATGDPIFNRIWTALGVPCLGFPAQRDINAMPLGAQIIGKPGMDRQLIKQASWVIRHGSIW